MKIFVYEHVTGGGMAGEEPSPVLVHEADLMLRSLLGDLGELGGITTFTTRDPRLPPIPEATTLNRLPGESQLELYRRGVRDADCVWPTAPETGGALEQLCRLVLTEGRTLLGSRPDAVKLTTSKRATALHLSAAGIPVVPTFALDSRSDISHDGHWVVKPDDGAGADDTLVFPERTSAIARLIARGPTHVLQPWVDGAPASLSLLCCDGQGRLLTCNRQEIRLSEGHVILAGIEVNGEKARCSELAPLAARIAAAIPDLWGYVGVDLVLTPHGPVVLEINPRLTTSWCGLRQALGVNPVQWIIEMARTGSLPAPPSPLEGRTCRLDLEPTSVR